MSAPGMRSVVPTPVAAPALVAAAPAAPAAPATPLARLLRGVGWSLLGTTLGRVLAVATTVVAAQLLGADQFGRMTLALSSCLLLAGVAGLGMPTATTHQVATWRTRDPHRAGAVVRSAVVTAAGGGVATALALVLAAPLLARHVYHDPSSTGVLQVAALLVIGLTLQAAQTAVFAGLEAFDRGALVTALSAAAALVGTVAGAWLDGARGAVVGTGVAALATAAVQQQLLRRALADHGIPLGRAAQAAPVGELRAVARTAFVTNVLVIGTNWLGTVLLARGADGLAQAAHFQAATQWRTAVLHVPLAAAGPLLAVLTHAAGTGDRRAHGSLSRTGILAVGGIAALLAALVAVAAPWLAGLYGPAFAAAATPLALLVASAVPMALSQAVGQLVISRGRHAAGMWACAAWAVVLGGAAAWWIPRHGAAGLAAAHLVAYPVQLAVLAFAARDGADASSGSRPDR